MAQLLPLMHSSSSSLSPSSSFPYLCSPVSPSVSRVARASRGIWFACSVSGPKGNHSSRLVPSSALPADGYIAPEASAGGRDGGGYHDGRSGGGGWSGEGGGEEGRESSGAGSGGLFGAFMKGWRDRARTDPQFPFKVLMEEVVGVSACVIGDMASRPNFGLNELDFVFSTIVVGCLLNFTLMFMLAPTSAIASASLPSVFASCPPGHMFENGAYSVVDRFGTFVYKGALFAAVGFAAGLVGTFTCNSLIAIRKKLDPNFVSQNTPPPTFLNASTWAIHMGLSSNLRYQALNGLEFGIARFLNPTAFKAFLFVTRGLNNVLGGMTFVALARLTGSQKAQVPKVSTGVPTTVKKASSSATEAGEPTVAE